MNSQTLRSSIAAGAAAVLGLAVSVALGVVPRATGDDGNVRLISVHGVGADVPFQPLFESAHPAVTTAHPAHGTVRHHVRQSATSASGTVAPAVATSTAPRTSEAGVTAHFVSAAAATTKHPAKTAKKKHHKKAHKGKKTKARSAPKLAPRTHPTSTAVSNAIAGLKKYVHTPFSINSSEVSQFGDDVCSAFDANETFAHIKAVILSKVKQIPFTTVDAGAADYVVKTAVKLYCPAYSSRAK